MGTLSLPESTLSEMCGFRKQYSPLKKVTPPVVQGENAYLFPGASQIATGLEGCEKQMLFDTFFLIFFKLPV